MCIPLGITGDPMGIKVIAALNLPERAASKCGTKGEPFSAPLGAGRRYPLIGDTANHRLYRWL